MSFISYFQWSIVKTLLNGAFMRVLLIFFILVTNICLADTYSQRGRVLLNESYHELQKDLMDFNEISSPVSVKLLRKDIGKFKIYLDVFMYAYPKNKKEDLLLKLRDEIDLGYEVFGKFKDLNDSFDPDELTAELINERRELALAWKKDFLNTEKVITFSKYLDQPLLDNVQERKSNVLPKFFWQKIKFPIHEVNDSKSVLAYLLNNMMDQSSKYLVEITEFKNLFSKKRENKFHDFRKLVRAHLKLASEFFASSVELGGDKVDQYNYFTNLVIEFGDINDLLVKYHHKQDSDLKKKIQKKWKTMKIKIEDEKINNRLHNFIF